MRADQTCHVKRTRNDTVDDDRVRAIVRTIRSIHSILRRWDAEAAKKLSCYVWQVDRQPKITVGEIFEST